MSQKSKHTPAPWKVFNAWQSGDAVKFSRIGNDDETIITVQDSDDITAFKEADLHLIAAAPEMLEALENTLWHLDHRMDREDIRRQQEYIMKVIAKAKGESA